MRRAVVCVMAVVCALALILGLVACEREEQGCQDLFGLEPGGGPAVGLVVDRTVSTQAFRLPESTAAAIRDASAGNGRISVLAVDGADAAPRWVLQDAALNDAELDPDTDRFDRITGLAVGCVEELLTTAGPSTPGSDVLTAVQRMADAVADDPAARVHVVTDGLANAGPLDLNQVAVLDAQVQDVVQAVAAAGHQPRFAGQPVEFHGIGQTAGAPLAQPVREWLRELWTAICLTGGATGCAAAPEDVPVAGDGRESQVADAEVAVPGIEPVSVDGGCRWTVGSALLFDGDSADLRPGAAEALAPIAAALRTPGAQADIVGHTSSAGTESGRQTTSELRARAVEDVLVGSGISPDHLEASGVGAEKLLVPDRDAAGRLVEAAAAQNRRVEVTVTGGRGCDR